MTCADLPSEECGQCCAQDHATGFDVLNNSYLTNCACADGSTCAADCNTADAATDLCLDDGTFNFKITNDACVTCLDGVTGMDPCFEPIRDDCTSEPDCIAYIQCAQGCPE